MATNKSVVTISRKWDKPEILSWVNDEEVGSGMRLDKFIAAVAFEMGSPALMITRAQLLDRMQQAAQAVSEEMKAATVNVVS